MFGDILKELRMDAELTQEELAQKFNITATAISKYETGDREPTLDFLVKISDYFDVSVDYMLGKTKVSTPVHILHSFNKYPSDAIKKLSEILMHFKHDSKYIDFVYSVLIATKKLK